MPDETEGFTDEGWPAEPPPPSPEGATALPSEPVMDLLEAAWGLIANAGGGDWDSQHEDWREAAGKWRDRYHVVLKAFCESRPPASLADASAAMLPSPDEPPLPDGEFGRVELPGYRQHTGWVTEGTRGGAHMAVVRCLPGLCGDLDGHMGAEVAIGPGCQFVHLPTPLKRPEAEPQRALPAGDGSGYRQYPDEGPW